MKTDDLVFKIWLIAILILWVVLVLLGFFTFPEEGMLPAVILVFLLPICGFGPFLFFHAGLFLARRFIKKDSPALPLFLLIALFASTAGILSELLVFQYYAAGRVEVKAVLGIIAIAALPAFVSVIICHSSIKKYIQQKAF